MKATDTVAKPVAAVAAVQRAHPDLRIDEAGDRFGRRRMFTTGLVLFTATSGAALLMPMIAVTHPLRPRESGGWTPCADRPGTLWGEGEGEGDAEADGASAEGRLQAPPTGTAWPAARQSRRHCWYRPHRAPCPPAALGPAAMCRAWPRRSRGRTVPPGAAR